MVEAPGSYRDIVRLFNSIGPDRLSDVDCVRCVLREQFMELAFAINRVLPPEVDEERLSVRKLIIGQLYLTYKDVLQLLNGGV